MPSDRARGLAIVAILFLAILPGASQDAALRILSASPDGDLAELADAGQIRVIFSEPMVALGTVLSGQARPGFASPTASDLAREAAMDTNADWWSKWRRGSFDHVERHDDRVQAFATRLASGRHELTYLVRATTPGTFQAAGARVEAMYAPEVGGRSQAATVTVK